MRSAPEIALARNGHLGEASYPALTLPACGSKGQGLHKGVMDILQAGLSLVGLFWRRQSLIPHTSAAQVCLPVAGTRKGRA